MDLQGSQDSGVNMSHRLLHLDRDYAVVHFDYLQDSASLYLPTGHEQLGPQLWARLRNCAGCILILLPR